MGHSGGSTTFGGSVVTARAAGLSRVPQCGRVKRNGVAGSGWSNRAWLRDWYNSLRHPMVSVAAREG